MSRWKSSVLHEGEGNIRSVKWRGHLIAWANNMVRARPRLPAARSEPEGPTRALGPRAEMPLPPLPFLRETQGQRDLIQKREEIRLPLAFVRESFPVYSGLCFRGRARGRENSQKMKRRLNNGSAALGMWSESTICLLARGESQRWEARAGFCGSSFTPSIITVLIFRVSSLPRVSWGPGGCFSMTFRRPGIALGIWGIIWQIRGMVATSQNLLCPAGLLPPGSRSR